jgi:hypothetical protein
VVDLIAWAATGIVVSLDRITFEPLLDGRTAVPTTPSCGSPSRWSASP